MTFSLAFGINSDAIEFYEANSEGTKFKKINAWSVDIGQCNGNCKHLDMELQSLSMFSGDETPKTFCTPSHTSHLILKFQSTVCFFVFRPFDVIFFQNAHHVIPNIIIKECDCAAGHSCA